MCELFYPSPSLSLSLLAYSFFLLLKSTTSAWRYVPASFFGLTTIRRKWITAAEEELFSYLPNRDTERGVCRWLGDKNRESLQYRSAPPVKQCPITVLRILSYQKNIGLSSDSPLDDICLIAASNVSHVCNMCRKKDPLTTCSHPETRYKY